MLRLCTTFLLRARDKSFVLGILATVIFYAVIHQPSMHGTILFRYTTEHIVEYAIVVLFFFGAADVLLKLASFPRELFALREDWLPARSGRERVRSAKDLLDRVQSKPRWLRESKMGRRLIQALQYVCDRGTAEDYREHLQYLAQQDEDHTSSKYTLLRFVIAVSPILGFLGTVVHFGTALSGFTFDDMAARLPQLVGEMGQAFNTTTVALATTMTMTFALFPCERIDQNIVKTTDRFIDRELLNRFEVQMTQVEPFLAVVQSAMEEASEKNAEVLERYVELLTQSLDKLFEKFDARQQRDSQGWQNALDVMQRRFEEYDSRNAERFRHSFSLIESHHEVYLNQIRTTLESAAAVRDDFAAFARTIDSFSRPDEQIIPMPAQHDDARQAVPASTKIEGTSESVVSEVPALPRAA